MEGELQRRVGQNLRDYRLAWKPKKLSQEAFFAQEVGGVFRLAGTVLLTNTDPDWSLHPTRVRASGVKFDGNKADSELQFVGSIFPKDGAWEIPPGRTLRFDTFLDLPAGTRVPAAQVVTARVDFRDQFQRWHRGQGVIEFGALPPIPPASQAKEAGV